MSCADKLGHEREDLLELVMSALLRLYEPAAAGAYQALKAAGKDKTVTIGIGLPLTGADADSAGRTRAAGTEAPLTTMSAGRRPAGRTGSGRRGTRGR